MTTETKLTEFVTAQEAVYHAVRRELEEGRKRTHWMWFIFPQMLGLGFSQMARRFGLDSLSEAQAYLRHDILGPRLRECTRLMLAMPAGRDITAVLGSPDDMKFRSSMTLFAAAEPGEPIFQSALDKYFGGEADEQTLRLLRQKGEVSGS